MILEEKKSIHAGHRKRMRERFMIFGLDDFDPHEVLELLLFEHIPQCDTNPLGHRLIESFGDVKGVLTASYDDLLKVCGIGSKTASGILSVYPILSGKIAAWFRGGSPLTEHDIVFLYDWFMDWMPYGSMGLLTCGHDRVFRDFYRIAVQDDMLFSLAEQIVSAAKGEAYYLVIREDFNLLPKEKAKILRLLTGRYGAYMLDAFVMERSWPNSLLK